MLASARLAPRPAAGRLAPPPSRPGRPVGRSLLAPPPAAAAGGPSAGLKELGAAVAAATGVSDKDGTAAVRALLDAIEENVAKGVKVTVPGFGTFERKERAARVGRNPKTGAELQIAAKKYPAFTAGKTFKDKVAS